MTIQISDRGIPDNLGILFNQVVIPPCCLKSLFYLNDEGVFTISFEGFYYHSTDYGVLVEFIKGKAARLSEYDVIPF